ncbi:MAG: SDR family oxidoreductase [Candidatus Abyssobacteria bacterium SURF_5]|uniref:SDR family oxidoreductase n=1 Tax=Abyssobacteria bacterium (strain SURF_5) TaxID=2093360 RepID=A0A3A4NRX5_ABYX5|nr:MAG: SDR family oxidoreductase [Candidatus Abyssubacteria bacterium SURF_5]
MSRFEGKTAFITGVGRVTGIGAAIAVRLAREGANVVISDICLELKDAPGYGMGSWDQLNETAETIRKAGGKSIAVKCDVTDAADVEAALEKTESEFGGIDILVNNAGGNPGSAPILMMEEAAWRKTLEINATGAFLCSKAAAQKMVGRGGGKIVNLSSRTAKTPAPYLAAYIAAKQAVIGLTRAMALELAPFHITVNAVCPGFIDTDLTREGHARQADALGISIQDIVDEKVKAIPIGRPGTPADVAGVVAFLCSPDADYMTGQALNITGGWEMH